jgi:hypothetical protein
MRRTRRNQHSFQLFDWCSSSDANLARTRQKLTFSTLPNSGSCIAIRSMLRVDGKGSVQVGAGIVADSVP